MHRKSGKIAMENIKATEKKKFQYYKNRVRLAKILNLEHCVTVFSKTFYLLRQQK